MAMTEPFAPGDIAQLARLVASAPHQYMWTSFDSEADVLYVNFKRPAVATDSELTDDDIIVRYEGEEIVGFTVLHASARAKSAR